MKRTRLALAVALWNCLSACGHSRSGEGGEADRSAPPIADVSVDVEHPGTAVPARFIGLSIEWGGVMTLLGDGKGGANPVTVQLLRNFASDGHQVHLRIGGNSTDRTWLAQDGGTPPAGATINVTPAFLSTFQAVHAATGAPFIIGVNFGLNDPAIAGAQLRAALAALPAGMVEAYELGNEPDLYRSTGRRASTYAFPDYQADVQRFMETLGPMVENRRVFALPAVASGRFLPDLTKLMEAQKPHLAVVTAHRYPFSVCRPTDVPPKPADLLTDRGTLNFATAFRPRIQSAQEAGLPFRLGETNSISCGGVAGVSDVFVAGLWGAHALFELATLGASGLNFHSSAKYAPFMFRPDGKVAVQGLYYGMLLFSRATANEGRFLPVKVNSAARVRAWATLGSDNTVRVALLNEDLAAAGRVTVRLSSPHRPAELFRLTGPALDAAAGIRFGGATFDGTTDGNPVGTITGEPVPADGAGTSYTVSLPATSGAVLVAPRAGR